MSSNDHYIQYSRKRIPEDLDHRHHRVMLSSCGCSDDLFSLGLQWDAAELDNDQVIDLDS